MSLFDSGIRPAVDAWLLNKSKEVRNYGDYWSASSAGYCMRRVIFERLGVPKVESAADARKQRVFTSGHLFHEWLQGITKEAGLSIAQELELQDEELLIRGHIDDLVLVGGSTASEEYVGADTIPLIPHGKPSVTKEELQQAMDAETGEKWDKKALKQILDATPPKHLILYDYKTVNSRAFLWAKKNGGAMSHYHKMQLGTYMYMLRKEREAGLKKRAAKATTTTEISAIYSTMQLTEARILKIEKDTLMMMEQQLMWSPELEKEVYSYWSTLNGYWKSKKLPRCTCADYEGGFLAKETYNGFYYDGEPCSLKYYEEWKAKK